MITSDKVAAKKEKKRKEKENNSKITNWSFIKKQDSFAKGIGLVVQQTQAQKGANLECG